MLIGSDYSLLIEKEKIIDILVPYPELRFDGTEVNRLDDENTHFDVPPSL